MKIIALAALLTVSGFTASAQQLAQVQIQTSAVCGMCKKTLEKAMAYEKGVKAAELDVASKTLTIAYRPDKTTPDALRRAVQATGYDADTQPAEARAYQRLPECCQKDAAPHEE